MKKYILLIAFAISLGSYTNAQSNLSKAEFELYQSIYGMEKKTVMNDYIDIDESSKAIFWELYDQYEAEREELGKGRMKLLYDYVENHEEMNDEKLKELMKQAMAKQKKNQKLLDKYYKQMLKQTSPQVATKFYQLESYLM